ncbi:MAG: ParM/StbA family protein [Butyrivibrio sp.]|nr:ParM/StbA family protein [Butyrivibrio sp.]
MIRLEDGKYIIGFDDGYQLGKTANFIFDNGVHMLGSVEPTLKEHSLFYDGEYFKVGEGRAAITEDKISDDNARLRTMAGIAMELGSAGIYKADVVLAAGLPFSNYGRDKIKLIDYYERQPKLDFSYEGEEYSVAVVKVIVCPQCYSAVASRLGNMKGDYLVVDIGSKTTDVVYVRNGLPIESRSITIEKAVVKWMKEIQHDMKVQTGKEIPEHEIMKVLLKEESHLPTVYIELIRRMLREKIRSLELELSERGYSLDYINLIYVGGGALMARDHAGKYRSHTAYDCDLCANAKGYEFLAGQIMGKKVV